jgi:D-alanine-D-alanine ligase
MSQLTSKICVLFGGESAEHEVSCRSARFVLESLGKKTDQLIPVGITKEGRWYPWDQAIPDEFCPPKDKPSFEIGDFSPKALFSRIFGLAQPLSPEHHVVFPVLHGTFGEDGTLQGLCELAGVSYVGSDTLGSALAMNKVLAKEVVGSLMPIVPYRSWDLNGWQKNKKELLEQVYSSLKPPYFVKPVSLGSSVGISKVERPELLEAAIEVAFLYDREILVEEGLESPRELECALLGDSQNLRTSQIAEIVPQKGGFYTYEAKYLDPQGMKARIEAPAQIPAELSLEIQKKSREIFQKCHLSGMARIDFFYDESRGGLYFNEVNTIPGFTSISQYPALWRLEGLDGPELCAELIEIAKRRGLQIGSLRRGKPI